jgi:hypothetical protein
VVVQVTQELLLIVVVQLPVQVLRVRLHDLRRGSTSSA